MKDICDKHKQEDCNDCFYTTPPVDVITHQHCSNCGFNFHTVPPVPVSRTCSQCGYVLSPINK